ncbi:protein mono-ADP-ribosyltransferase PARP12-like [Watersipora subatra]|uniref:protein mono-ADP-ribosyltransferase PARP12-like n=1 Tax=Watersipora subatra TaxID=2589382 RepID=UPI00355B7801
MSNLFDRISSALKDVFLPFPSSWERTLGRGQYFVVLSPSTQEYTDVQTMFLRTSGPCIVTQIKRVQNLALYRMTEAYKEKIAEETRSTCNNVQRQLWHGTSGSNVQLICANGFSRSYAKPGLAIGQGTYFSTTSQGSMSYAGDSSIILARVTVGRYVQGASGMTQQTLPSGYHSTVNITECPQVFVVYHDAAAYPEYIISFRR